MKSATQVLISDCFKHNSNLEMDDLNEGAGHFVMKLLQETDQITLANQLLHVYSKLPRNRLYDIISLVLIRLALENLQCRDLILPILEKTVQDDLGHLQNMYERGCGEVFMDGILQAGTCNNESASFNLLWSSYLQLLEDPLNCTTILICRYLLESILHNSNDKCETNFSDIAYIIRNIIRSIFKVDLNQFYGYDIPKPSSYMDYIIPLIRICIETILARTRILESENSILISLEVANKILQMQSVLPYQTVINMVLKLLNQYAGCYPSSRPLVLQYVQDFLRLLNQTLLTTIYFQSTDTQHEDTKITAIRNTSRQLRTSTVCRYAEAALSSLIPAPETGDKSGGEGGLGLSRESQSESQSHVQPQSQCTWTSSERRVLVSASDLLVTVALKEGRRKWSHATCETLELKCHVPESGTCDSSPPIQTPPSSPSPLSMEAKLEYDAVNSFMTTFAGLFLLDVTELGGDDSALSVLLERLVGEEDWPVPYSCHGGLDESRSCIVEEKEEAELVGKEEVIVDQRRWHLSVTGPLTASSCVLQMLIAKSSEALGRVIHSRLSELFLSGRVQGVTGCFEAMTVLALRYRDNSVSLFDDAVDILIVAAAKLLDSDATPSNKRNLESLSRCLCALAGACGRDCNRLHDLVCALQNLLCCRATATISRQDCLGPSNWQTREVEREGSQLGYIVAPLAAATRLFAEAQVVSRSGSSTSSSASYSGTEGLTLAADLGRQMVTAVASCDLWSILVLFDLPHRSDCRPAMRNMALSTPPLLPDSWESTEQLHSSSLDAMLQCGFLNRVGGSSRQAAGAHGLMPSILRSRLESIGAFDILPTLSDDVVLSFGSQVYLTVIMILEMVRVEACGDPRESLHYLTDRHVNTSVLISEAASKVVVHVFRKWMAIRPRPSDDVAADVLQCIVSRWTTFSKGHHSCLKEVISMMLLAWPTLHWQAACVRTLFNTLNNLSQNPRVCSAHVPSGSGSGSPSNSAGSWSRNAFSQRFVGMNPDYDLTTSSRDTLVAIAQDWIFTGLRLAPRCMRFSLQMYYLRGVLFDDADIQHGSCCLEVSDLINGITQSSVAAAGAIDYSPSGGFIADLTRRTAILTEIHTQAINDPLEPDATCQSWKRVIRDVCLDLDQLMRNDTQLSKTKQLHTITKASISIWVVNDLGLWSSQMQHRELEVSSLLQNMVSSTIQSYDAEVVARAVLECKFICSASNNIRLDCVKEICNVLRKSYSSKKGLFSGRCLCIRCCGGELRLLGPPTEAQPRSYPSTDSMDSSLDIQIQAVDFRAQEELICFLEGIVDVYGDDKGMITNCLSELLSNPNSLSTHPKSMTVLLQLVVIALRLSLQPIDKVCYSHCQRLQQRCIWCALQVFLHSENDIWQFQVMSLNSDSNRNISVSGLAFDLLYLVSIIKFEGSNIADVFVLKLFLLHLESTRASWENNSQTESTTETSRSFKREYQSISSAQLVVAVQSAWKIHPLLAVRLVHIYSAEKYSIDTINWLGRKKLCAGSVLRGLIRAEPFALVSSWEAVHLIVDAIYDEPTLAEVLRRCPACPIWVALQLLGRWTQTQSLRTLSNRTSDPRSRACVREYALRSMSAMLDFSPETLSFYLPQLVQVLRIDAVESSNLMQRFLLNAARKSSLFCHQLVWNLQTECSHSSMETRRSRGGYGFCRTLSGEDPLPNLATGLLRDIRSALNPNALEYLDAECGYFNALTNISAKLKQVKDKSLHKDIIQNAIADIEDASGLYLPTDSSLQVLRVNADSGVPMQSAAKCPFLLTFVTTRWRGPEDRTENLNTSEVVTVPSYVLSNNRRSSVQFKDVDVSPKHLSRLALAPLSPIAISPCPPSVIRQISSLPDDNDWRRVIAQRMHEDFASGSLTVLRIPREIASSFSRAFEFLKHAQDSGQARMLSRAAGHVLEEDYGKGSGYPSLGAGQGSACIFKAYDDCRQDALAIQVIRILQEAFHASGLPLELVPYAVVCNRVGDHGVSGAVIEVVPDAKSRDQIGKGGAKNLFEYFVSRFGSPQSESFAIAKEHFCRSLAAYAVVCYLLGVKDRHNGNLLIDGQGRIVHIDFGFLLGTSPAHNMGFERAPFKLSKDMVHLLGGLQSQTFFTFTELVVKGFLVSRAMMPAILSLVSVSSDSGLPCFMHRTDVLMKLKRRFQPKLSADEAADYMRLQVHRAATDWTTNMYDKIQKFQNNIYY